MKEIDNATAIASFAEKPLRAEPKVTRMWVHRMRKRLGLPARQVSPGKKEILLVWLFFVVLHNSLHIYLTILSSLRARQEARCSHYGNR